MTTTERPRAPSSSATNASPLRLYLVAFLATAYVVVWWWLGARAPSESAELGVLEPAPEASARPATAWLDELSPAERAAVQPPPGWHIVDRTAPAASVSRRAAPVPVRVSPARRGRIRTRSS
jgi:hypothetical protein